MNDLVSWDDYSDCSEEPVEEIIKPAQSKLSKKVVADKPYSSTNVVNLKYKIRLMLRWIINPSLRLLLDQIGITLIKI